MEDEILEGFSIGAFFQEQESQGWMPDTKQRYAKCLYELRDFLAGKGPPGRELLNQWQRQLESRYSRSGVQVCLAAANGYFQWCGRPDLQLYPAQSREGEEGDEIPAVTREEYLKLLRAARTLGRQRSYLLVKLFATTGLPLQCLEQVTAEVVRQGGRHAGPPGHSGGVPLSGRPAAGAAGVSGGQGDPLRSGLCLPHRQAAEPLQHFPRHAGALPGRRGARGKGEPQQPAQAVPGDPGAHPRGAGFAAAPGLRPDFRAGTGYHRMADGREPPGVSPPKAGGSEDI